MSFKEQDTIHVVWTRVINIWRRYSTITSLVAPPIQRQGPIKHRVLTDKVDKNDFNFIQKI
jgi:hypothetical protein